MFNFDKEEPQEVPNIPDLEAEKKRIDAELDLYRRKQRAKIDQEIDNLLVKRKEELVDFEKKCHIQLGEWEHDFHSGKEEKRAELAKLDAKIEALNEESTMRDKLLEQKDHEIQRLESFITSLINVLGAPVVTIGDEE